MEKKAEENKAGSQNPTRESGESSCYVQQWEGLWWQLPQTSTKTFNWFILIFKKKKKKQLIPSYVRSILNSTAHLEFWYHSLGASFLRKKRIGPWKLPAPTAGATGAVWKSSLRNIRWLFHPTGITASYFWLIRDQTQILIAIWA